MTPVEASVTRTGTNKGTVKITVASLPQPVSVMGSIEVSAKEIKATDVEVDPPAAITDPTIATGLQQGLTLEYKLSDDGKTLDVTNAALFTVLLGPSNTTIQLTKQ
jgi:hypothetical protein